MKPIDFFVIAVILLIVATAAFCIYKSKKNGKKCIGCPNSDTCCNCTNCNKRDSV